MRGRVAKYVLRESRDEMESPNFGVVAFGGEGDDEHLFSDMMWADNCWLLSDVGRHF